MAGEGFRYQREHDPAWEDLKSTVTLAILMGFTVVYDPDYRDRRNLIGQVPLDRWPGKTGKNGGGYQYAFTGRTVLASPTLPPEHGINMAPRKEDFLQTIRQIIDLQEKVGRTGELVLG